MSLWEEKAILSPSVISVCDLCNLETSVRQLEEAGIELLHIDILDGHFSPSMPLGLDTVRRLRELTSLPFDAHVMATENAFFIEQLLEIGAAQVVFHAETEPHIDHWLNVIHAAGARAGVALKPATPLSTVAYVLEKCDVVELMLINPGYASSARESQVPYADRKIRELRQMIDERQLPAQIEIDGRISRQNLEDYQNGIVNLYVAGSTCLDKANLRESAQRLLSEVNGMKR